MLSHHRNSSVIAEKSHVRFGEWRRSHSLVSMVVPRCCAIKTKHTMKSRLIVEVDAEIFTSFTDRRKTNQDKSLHGTLPTHEKRTRHVVGHMPYSVRWSGVAGQGNADGHFLTIPNDRSVGGVEWVKGDAVDERCGLVLLHTFYEDLGPSGKCGFLYESDGELAITAPE